MTDTARIALLIDADNARARRIEVILGELSALGETTIRRAYGNFTKAGLKGWVDRLHEHGIRPVQQFDLTRGKNASDMALAVDAVEILHSQRPDAFAIVSSDADFTPLVMHLKEHGVAVYGFGDAKTPAPFQSACTRFLVLDQLEASEGDDADRAGAARSGGRATGEEPAAGEDRPAKARKATKRATSKATTATKGTAQPEAGQPDATRKDTATTDGGKADTPPARATRAQLRGDDRLVALLRRAVASASDDSGWARIGTVGQRINNQSSFDSRNYGYAKLSRLIEATELFEVRGSGTTDMAVRDPRAS